MPEAVSKNVQSKESLTLATPVQYLKGVGPARAALFEKLGVQTVGDLLEYFPRDWVFAPGRIKISQMRPNEPATGLAGTARSATVSTTCPAPGPCAPRRSAPAGARC